MIAFRLFGKERGTTLCDVERVAQIVRNDARKLLEPLVLPA